LVLNTHKHLNDLIVSSKFLANDLIVYVFNTKIIINKFASLKHR